VPAGKSLFNEERERFRHGNVTPAVETASRACAYLVNAFAGCSLHDRRVATIHVAAKPLLSPVI
jgi:hypothetical protein